MNNQGQGGNSTAGIFDLTGRTALVTGSSGGLGKAMAEGLGQAGAHVVLNGRSKTRLDSNVSELAERGLSVSHAVFDITDIAASTSALDQIEKKHGQLDILINNVGIRDRRNIFDFDPEAVERMLKVNLVAPFELSRIAARGMMARGWGRIINISSVVGQIAWPGDAIYITVKGGLDSLTRALAAEFGKSGITVNAIAPGFFATDANADRLEDSTLTDWLQNRTALGRWATPGELAGPAVFLASDSASYVTGHTLVVDGGMLGHL